MGRKKRWESQEKWESKCKEKWETSKKCEIKAVTNAPGIS